MKIKPGLLKVDKLRTISGGPPEKIEAILLSMYAEKTFDSVGWEFLYTVIVTTRVVVRGVVGVKTRMQIF